jgi:hypothetical protein
LTRTSRIGYTKDRMRLLKPQAPTCKGQDLGQSSMGSKLDNGVREDPGTHNSHAAHPSGVPSFPWFFLWQPHYPQSRLYLAVKVAQAAVALGSPIELGHLGNVEAAGEVGPDGLPKTVAQCHAYLVPGLCLPGRLVQEVPAQLTNVLHNLRWAWCGSRFLGCTTSLLSHPYSPSPLHGLAVQSVSSLSGPQSPHMNNGNVAQGTLPNHLSCTTDTPKCMGMCVGAGQGTGTAHPLPFSLTVQLYLIQSSQNREAENFFRITTVMPWIRHWPTPTIFPEGRGAWRSRTHGPDPQGLLLPRATSLQALTTVFFSSQSHLY